MYPLKSYRYFVGKNEVIALSSFAKRSVRGKAKCHPGDEFDVEIGKKLAGLRCGLKIANKRAQCAAKKVALAEANFAKAKAELNAMYNYHADALDEVREMTIALNDFCDTIYKNKEE